MSRTPGLLRRQLWLWPLFAAAMLLFVGLWVRSSMERAMGDHVAGNLRTIVDANAEALREWAASRRSLAELLADDGRVRELAGGLLSRRPQTGEPSPLAWLNASEAGLLRAYLQPMVEARGFKGYALLDTNLVVIGSGLSQLVGITSPPVCAEALQTCLAGNAKLTRPFIVEGRKTEQAPGVGGRLPLMFAAAPIHAPDHSIIAVLGLRILPETDFTRILGTARCGRSGETYAFGRGGVLLSESRFDDELKRFGLIPDSPGARSILALEARDPLVNLRKGRLSPNRRSELPFTQAVSEALAGRPGVCASGYRDYRGVLVVGAWTWLPEFDMGLVTELDRGEAFEPVLPIRLAFWFLFGLLTAGSGVVFLLMRVARQSALRANQLGQYCLEEEIGSGGFGTVFRARHALMRRPVAVKVLDPTAGASSVARFEREVQLTSQLTHPNTIALYDYGHTPEGLFYYAMEYLEGISLAVLIQQHGPQPEGRVIYILRQVCASLTEAHALGLVHRDIKPHNVLLTRRGGIPDFVKVLDFGLVKARELAADLQLTAAHATLGTPLYMSPEAVKGPDRVTPISDIYSLGAVGYELLTGSPVFSGATVAEVLIHQVNSTPETPSARLKRPVSPDLEQLLMRCLSKSLCERPDAVALEEALGRCNASGSWGRLEAEEWWRKQSMLAKAPAPAGSGGG